MFNIHNPVAKINDGVAKIKHLVAKIGWAVRGQNCEK